MNPKKNVYPFHNQLCQDLAYNTLKSTISSKPTENTTSMSVETVIKLLESTIGRPSHDALRSNVVQNL